MNGWLLDTNVVAELARPQGARRVPTWASAQDEALLFLSILTLGEYDKGLSHLPPDSTLRPVISAGIAALEVRFAGRILTLTDPIVRRWGALSGAVKRQTGHAPPVIDTMLAATAIEHDLCLVTRNVRDVQHSGVTCLNPWERDGSST
ncbi:MAG TPA: type II toxin-antitoxin system VapC family toxin [Acetobacteraceae bacterium]|nr:type II toxin-antitoxin system VapC family toxin [Acetobacteraceae bacterium]